MEGLVLCLPNLEQPQGFAPYPVKFHRPKMFFSDDDRNL